MHMFVFIISLIEEFFNLLMSVDPMRRAQESGRCHLGLEALLQVRLNSCCCCRCCLSAAAAAVAIAAIAVVAGVFSGMEKAGQTNQIWRCTGSRFGA